MSYHRKNQIIAGAFFLALTLQTTTAAAQPDIGNRWSGPPPEAIEACASLEEGDVCTFTGRRGEDVRSGPNRLDSE